MSTIYDSEAMAADVADAVNQVFTSAEVGELFSRGNDSHAFNLVTPGGQKFLVTITQVGEDPRARRAREGAADGGETRDRIPRGYYCATCQNPQHATCGNSANCPCCRDSRRDNPPTCILTGQPGEDPDDCTTHRHEEEAGPEAHDVPSGCGYI
jgi:hypothetical protein